MKIDYPAQEQLPRLRAIWQEAFGDSEAFVNCFYDTAFAPDRCRCVTVEEQTAGALYWFDCRCQDQPVAYVYAVATAKKYRGRGLCRALMEDTAKHLRSLGYAGILLVPARGLFTMYGKMGYETCAYISEFTCTAGERPLSLRSVDEAEYARLRRELLPEGGVVQEGENLSFLAAQAKFYTGDGFLLAASAQEDALTGLELLGDADAAPGILTALGKSRGIFRTPGQDVPFAMFKALSDCPRPQYFGLAFD